MQTPTVYHFDINGTIIGTDSTNVGETIEHAAAEALARSVTWMPDGRLTQPHELSFYEQIKKTDPDYKQRIARLIDSHLHLKEKYDDLRVAFQGGLFESFLRLLEQRVVNQTKQVVVLRTFGYDGDQVIRMLKADDRFSNIRTFIWTEKLLDAERLSAMLELDRYQLVLFQDDYEKWNDANRDPLFGKVIDHMEGWQQFGFDDNPCMTMGKHADNIKLFRINTYSAATNPNYYIDLSNK